jgi:hypothetical protein
MQPPKFVRGEWAMIYEYLHSLRTRMVYAGQPIHGVEYILKHIAPYLNATAENVEEEVQMVRESTDKNSIG